MTVRGKLALEIDELADEEIPSKSIAALLRELN